MAFSKVRSLPELRRLSVPGAREVRRRSDLRPACTRAREHHVAHRARRRGEARDQRRRHRGHGGCGRRSTKTTRDLTAGHRRHLLRRRRQAPTPCWPRRPTNTPTASPTALTRSGATTCSTTARRCWRLSQGGEPDGVPEDVGVDDCHLSGGQDFDYPLGQHPDGRQVPRRRCSTVRSRVRRGSRPNWSLEDGRPVTQSTLALDRGSATA